MFKQVSIELPGFKYPVCTLKELSIKQLRNAPKDGDDYALMLYAVECGLFNDAGDKVINEQFTIEQFEEIAPQSYIEVLAEAFTKLNAPSDQEALEIAKNY